MSAARCVLLVCSMAAVLACHDSSTGPGAGAPLAIAWRVTPSTGTTGAWPGTPAVDAGRLFVEVGHDLAAFDAPTGRELWPRRVRVGAFPPPTTLVARNGRVCLSETDSVLAVDPATGRTLWTFHPDSQAVVTPAVDDDAVYTGQRGLPVVYALGAADGALRWRTNVGAGYQYPAYVTGLAASSDTVFVVVQRNLIDNGYLTSGVLVALDRRDGRELWRYETPGSGSRFRNAPLLAGTLVVVLDYLGKAVLGIDRTSHHVAWRADLGNVNAPIVAVLQGGVVYVGGSYGDAFALDASTGRRRWKTGVGSSVLGMGTCGAGVLVNEDHVKRLDAATGANTGSLDPVGTIYDAPFSSSIASDGALAYVVGNDGVYGLRC